MNERMLTKWVVAIVFGGAALINCGAPEGPCNEETYLKTGTAKSNGISLITQDPARTPPHGAETKTIDVNVETKTVTISYSQNNKAIVEVWSLGAITHGP